MRILKMVGLAAVSAMALASSASAVTWTPQGTVVSGHSSQLTLISGTATVTCTMSTFVKGSGAVATTTDAAGNPTGPTFSNCDSNIANPVTVTTSGAWIATATSTTAVDVTGNAVIKIGSHTSPTCTITAIDVTVPNNTWSNAATTLTANSSATGAFSITRHGFCPLTASTATMSGVVSFPSAMLD